MPVAGFHEVQLPDRIAQNAEAIPHFNTTINTSASGYEQRNQNWSKFRHKYDISHVVQSRTEYAELKAFHANRAGAANGFLFKDWSDYNMARQSIGTGDSSQDDFGIYKRYTNDSYDYDREITKPKNGTVQVWVNSVLQTETTHYTVNYETGVITFVSPPTSGHDIEVACDFFVPVRFATDELPSRIEESFVLHVENVELIEVRVRQVMP